MKSGLYTPWAETVDLIAQAWVKDAEGYETLTEVPHTVFCNFEDGVSQSEYYLSDKAGMRASAQVEIYKADMLDAWPRGTTGDRIVDFKGQRYKVVRDFPQGYDTQTLILTEVVR